MSLSNDLLEKVLLAQSALLEKEQELELAKAYYHEAVRNLHASGASIRAIATALQLSHQRVHQIIEASGGGWRQWIRRGRLRMNATCSFCNLKREDVGQLVAGPGLFICDRCFSVAMEAYQTESEVVTDLVRFTSVATGSRLRCSFCRRGDSKTRRLVAGDGQQICHECLEFCRELMVSNRRR